MAQDAIRAWASAAEHHCCIPSRQSFRQPICELDKACLTGDRLRLDRLSRNGKPQISYPGRLRLSPRPLTNLRLAALHFIPALLGAVRSSPVF